MDYNVPETKPIETGEQAPAETEAATAATESPKTIASRLDAGEAFVHNFTGDKREQYKMIARATGSGTIKSIDSIGTTIDLQHYFAHRVLMLDNKTGEEFDQLRVVLFSKDDKAYSFASAGITDSLNLLIGVFGNGPWTEPMEHKVIESKTNSGRKMLSLSPV